MPTYVYEVLDPRGQPTGRTFEFVQRMADEALTRHPESGEPVRRVPQAPAIAGVLSPARGKKGLSDKKLEKLGFTKYQRQTDGTYERRFGGAGPPTISKDD
ncbi:MAG: FmdB family transcriptional regulator [Phycisphaeraceae bacterium]|nr:FmdB family transcriptional regulator [Phycisphaeraceae bacterium]